MVAVIPIKLDGLAIGGGSQAGRPRTEHGHARRNAVSHAQHLGRPEAPRNVGVEPN